MHSQRFPCNAHFHLCKPSRIGVLSSKKNCHWVNNCNCDLHFLQHRYDLLGILQNKWTMLIFLITLLKWINNARTNQNAQLTCTGWNHVHQWSLKKVKTSILHDWTLLIQLFQFEIYDAYFQLFRCHVRKIVSTEDAEAELWMLLKSS